MLKRSLFFVYGVAAYLVFLATFLYAIAFVGGVEDLLVQMLRGLAGFKLLAQCVSLRFERLDVPSKLAADRDRPAVSGWRAATRY